MKPTPADHQLIQRIKEDEGARYQLAFSIRAELAKRAAKKKNILAWGSFVFPHKFKLPFCQELHQYIVDIRNDPLTATEAPRNHAKTTIQCFLVEIFQALEEPSAFEHYLNVQSTGSKAIDVNVSIKLEIETNPMIHHLYGFQVSDEKWTDQRFVLRNGTIFSAIGAGQSIRGINYRNKRPDFIVADDLYDEDDINNYESTKKKNNWFWSSLYPARAKGRRCAIHLQGTAINGWDLLEQMKKMARWKCRTFKAVVDDDAKKVLWPELNTYQSLQDDKYDMGSIIFNREMQNERLDEKESKIKRWWLSNWEFDPTWLSAEIQKGKLLQLTSIILTNDPSIGKDTESDDTGTALIYKTRYIDSSRDDYWIMRLEAEKLSLEERKNQLENINESQLPNEKVNEVRIEAIAAFDDYATYVVNKTSLPVTRISHVKDKISTLENKSHHFENGRVHLNKNIGRTSDGRDLKEMLMSQLTTNHPPHDDVRDSVLLALEDESGLWRFVV